MSLNGIGKLRTLKPADFSPPGQGQPPVDACAQAQCDYCKRFGPLGACQGCGAPNKPVQAQPTFIISAPGPISAGTAQRLLDISTFDKPRQFLVLPDEVNIVPVFPLVKR